jgi:hypothetical protein
VKAEFTWKITSWMVTAPIISSGITVRQEWIENETAYMVMDNFVMLYEQQPASKLVILRLLPEHLLNCDETWIFMHSLLQDVARERKYLKF